MSLQRPLTGQYKLVVDVHATGSMDYYLLHLPYPESRYGGSLLSKGRLQLTDEDLLDGDWAGLVERAAIAAGQ